MTPDLSWMDQAACRHHPDPDAWFAAPIDEASRQAIAKRTCSTCPVSCECLTYALMLRPTDGIWAGLDPRQIRQAIHQGNTTKGDA